MLLCIPLQGLPNVFTGMTFYLPGELADHDKVKRFVIAYDGDVVDDVDRASATHVVSAGKASQVSTAGSSKRT